jgi:hypothetical protein
MKTFHQLNIVFLPKFPRLCQELWRVLLPLYCMPFVLRQSHIYKLHFEHLGISILLLHKFLFINHGGKDLKIYFLQTNRILCWKFYWFLDFYCYNLLSFLVPKNRNGYSSIISKWRFLINLLQIIKAIGWVFTRKI